MEGILCHLSLEEGIHGDARYVLWNEEMEELGREKDTGRME